MKKQIVFSDANIVTIRIALYEAERAVRALTEELGEEYSSLAKSNLKFAEECHALGEYIFDQVVGGKSNG